MSSDEEHDLGNAFEGDSDPDTKVEQIPSDEEEDNVQGAEVVGVVGDDEGNRVQPGSSGAEPSRAEVEPEEVAPEAWQEGEAAEGPLPLSEADNRWST